LLRPLRGVMAFASDRGTPGSRAGDVGELSVL